MKRILFATGLFAVLVVSLSSCASSRDCRGVRHTRLSNGVNI